MPTVWTGTKRAWTGSIVLCMKRTSGSSPGADCPPSPWAPTSASWAGACPTSLCICPRSGRTPSASATAAVTKQTARWRRSVSRFPRPKSSVPSRTPYQVPFHPSRRVTGDETLSGMELEGGQDQGRTVGPVAPAVDAVELGQVPKRERLYSVTIYPLGHAGRPAPLLQSVHRTRRDPTETERAVESLSLRCRVETDGLCAAALQVGYGPGGEQGAEPEAPVPVMHGEMADNADVSKRYGADHAGQGALRSLRHGPAGVAQAPQQVESPGIGRPPDDTPQLQDAVEVHVGHPADAEGRIRLRHGPWPVPDVSIVYFVVFSRGKGQHDFPSISVEYS